MKYASFIAIVFYSLLTAFSVNAQPSHLRIVNGNASTVQREWMASLSPAGTKPYKTHFCGGTVIDSRTVLTAAHCVVDFTTTPHKLQVTVGRSKLSSSEGRIIKATGVVVHPRYRVDKLIYDVALVKLSSDVLLSQYPSIPLWMNQQNENGNALILGWGLTDPDKYQRSNMLQEAAIPLVNDTTCKRRMGSEYNTSQMICGGKLSSETKMDGVDSCNGDSGGPLMIQTENGFMVAGVTSWGIDCATNLYWGVYARTDVHRDWILSNPPIPPYAITPPRIIGKAKHGETLRCRPGTWGGDESASVQYRWIDVKKGVIKGATTQFYRLHKRDEGRSLQCEVRKRSVRQTSYARSKKVGPIK